MQMGWCLKAGILLSLVLAIGVMGFVGYAWWRGDSTKKPAGYSSGIGVSGTSSRDKKCYVPWVASGAEWPLVVVSKEEVVDVKIKGWMDENDLSTALAKVAEAEKAVKALAERKGVALEDAEKDVASPDDKVKAKMQALVRTGKVKTLIKRVKDLLKSLQEQYRGAKSDDRIDYQMETCTVEITEIEFAALDLIIESSKSAKEDLKAMGADAGNMQAYKLTSATGIWYGGAWNALKSLIDDLEERKEIRESLSNHQVPREIIGLIQSNPNCVSVDKLKSRAWDALEVREDGRDLVISVWNSLLNPAIEKVREARPVQLKVGDVVISPEFKRRFMKSGSKSQMSNLEDCELSDQRVFLCPSTPIWQVNQCMENIMGYEPMEILANTCEFKVESADQPPQVIASKGEMTIVSDRGYKSAVIGVPAPYSTSLDSTELSKNPVGVFHAVPLEVSYVSEHSTAKNVAEANVVSREEEKVCFMPYNLTQLLYLKKILLTSKSTDEWFEQLPKKWIVLIGAMIVVVSLMSNLGACLIFGHKERKQARIMRNHYRVIELKNAEARHAYRDLPE